MLVSWKISPLFSNLKTQNPFFRIHKQNIQDFWHIQFFQCSFFSAQDHSQPVSKQCWEFISHWIKKQKWRKQCLQCFQQTYLQRVVCSLATCLHLVALEKSEVDTVEHVNKLMFFNNRSTIFCDSPKLLTLMSAMKYNVVITQELHFLLSVVTTQTLCSVFFVVISWTRTWFITGAIFSFFFLSLFYWFVMWSQL